MTLENLALGIRKNSLKKMTLENLALGINQNHLVLQIIQNILEKNHQMPHLAILIKRHLILKVKKNLKVETVGLKILLLKNIAKKK